jgi:protein-S-isoprenylcysteine O-methyltransferase Ste14
MHRLLPPVLFVLLLALVGALALLRPGLGGAIHAGGWPVVAAVVLALAGLFLLIGARVQFVRSDSEIMTFAAPRNLVTTGLFARSRNPMYLGFTLLLLAAAMAANLWFALLAPLLFLLVAALWYVPAEERAARAVFGEAYASYAERTRRWV